MATKPIINPPGPHGGDAPQHFVPPTARELRAQAIHRLQVGLLGLAAMLLLVALASIIMERARMADGAMTAPVGIASPAAKPKSDPLADAGVIPSPEAARTAEALPPR